MILSYSGLIPLRMQFMVASLEGLNLDGWTLSYFMSGCPVTSSIGSLQHSIVTPWWAFIPHQLKDHPLCPLRCTIILFASKHNSHFTTLWCRYFWCFKEKLEHIFVEIIIHNKKNYDHQGEVVNKTAFAGVFREAWDDTIKRATIVSRPQEYILSIDMLYLLISWHHLVVLLNCMSTRADKDAVSVTNECSSSGST